MSSTDTTTPTLSAAEAALDPDEVVQALRVYLVEEFLPGTAPERVGTDLDLMNSGVIDSLGLLKLIAWIESRFEVGVDDTDLDPENFRSLTAIAGFVSRARSDGR
ncbi:MULTISPECIES: acyl carrier protein [unclassified Rathayibacter]|uniref:acyl carrier protein n=1 Tax=unclassified Rathayibacter TaxID=2609250 RepID=UPI00188AC1F8|nr:MULTISPECIES: acyl carrier protein [unclassified Rathayibacter]MBF4463173.1 acyl carrier protein [Rathayibacter sp. VKM Ac-2879]MBF4504590.1 acyl carrier protein [Rathayibacter sp. VKM Ac-2878]